MSDKTLNEPAEPTLDITASQDASIQIEDVPTLDPVELADVAAKAEADSAPAMTPPEEIIEADADSGITAWHNSKKITALWSSNSNRNSWIHIAGMGWKRLNNANDSSVLSMTMVASVAEQTNATVNVKIESDGKVHELYVW